MAVNEINVDMDETNVGMDETSVDMNEVKCDGLQDTQNYHSRRAKVRVGTKILGDGGMNGISVDRESQAVNREEGHL